MIFKRFAVWLLKNFIVLLVAMIIFSSITLEFPDFMKIFFGDIYEYASPESQRDVINRLTETCSTLGKGEDFVTVQQLCANATLLQSLKDNCIEYRRLKKEGYVIENEQEFEQSCIQVESGDIERQCGEFKAKRALIPDFNNIGGLCRDYNSGRISDKQFFYGVVGSSVNGMPQLDFFEEYNKLAGYLNNNKIAYLAVLVILFSLLYFVIRDSLLFASVLAGISLSIGILVLLPYIAIILYDKVFGINTTSVLQSMFGLGAINPKALISVVFLMFLRTYNGAIITIGALLLVMGITGKIYIKFFMKKELDFGIVEDPKEKPRNKRK